MSYTKPSKYRRSALALMALAPAVAAFATAAPAHAQAAEVATATSTEAAGLRYDGTSAANNVRFTLSGTTFTVDDIVPIQVGVGCSPVAGDATKVTCVAFKVAPNGRFKQFTASVHDGADTVVNQTSSATTDGAPMHALGGFGDDVLIGDPKAEDSLRGGAENDLLRDAGGRNELNGGADDDRLEGGSGGDTLRGTSGSDHLDGGGSDDMLDGGSGADIIDGGPMGISIGERRDEVTYFGRSRPVTVDLTRTDANQGGPGEGDTIRDVEDIRGGRANDRLFGNEENNDIDGAQGNDFISGNTGMDRLSGGDGDDFILPSPSFGFFGVAPDGVRDIIDCGDFGIGDGDPNDFAFRVLADNDFVNDCALVNDL